MLIGKEKIARYEKYAAKNPAAYRYRLTFIAVMGDVVLTILRMIPIALLVAFSSLFYGGVFFYIVGGATLILFLWLGRPDFRVGGRPLARDQAPALFVELDRLREKLAVTGNMEVRLDDEFNAGATETRGLFGLIGTRRVLMLGMPLLAILTREQVLAIVAHEFGHLSRRHGRLGHWLYRTRVGWLRYEESSRASARILTRAIAWYGRAFVPYFSALAFVHSRHCEYEADADAASVAGAGQFAEALSATVAFSALWDEEIPRRLILQMEQSAVVPDNYLQQLTETARSVPMPTKQSWFDQALKRQSNASDTHPSLTARLAALKVMPPLAPLDNMAGDLLLGAAWPGIAKAANEAWRKREQLAWLLGHHFCAHVTRDLLLATDEMAAGWPPERKLARSLAMRRRDFAHGLDQLKQLHGQYPLSIEIAACCALACLEERDAEGVAMAEDVWQRAPSCRRKIADALCEYYRITEEMEKLEAWQLKLAGVTEARALLIDDVVRSALADTHKNQFVTPSVATFTPPVHAFLTAAMREDDRVAAAWAFTGTRAIVTKNNKDGEPLAIHLLALVIDPEITRARECDEYHVADCYQRVLSKALSVSDEVVVITFFTTEKLPARFTTANAFVDKRQTQTTSSPSPSPD